MCCQNHKGMRAKVDVVRLAIGIFMTPYISGWQQRFAARDNSREQLLWFAAMHALNQLPVRGRRLH